MLSGIFRKEAGNAPDDSTDSRTPPRAFLLFQQIVVIGHLTLVLITAHLDREEAGLEIDGVHEVGVERGEEGFTAATSGTHTQTKAGSQGAEVVTTTGATQLGSKHHLTAIGIGQAESIDTGHNKGDA